jgi:hypothetical protein
VSSRATSGGKIVTTPNQIAGSAVAAQDNFGELRADLVVAWIERVTTDAGQYDRLLASQVICQPAQPDGG